MVQQLKAIGSTFAALLTVAFALVNYAAALPPGSSAAGMVHDAAASGCPVACGATIGLREGEWIATEDNDDQDSLKPVPFYVALRPGPSPARQQAVAERFVRKPPPKVPLYIQFAQLRP